MANKSLKVGGFPEWLPKEQLLENKIKEFIAKEYAKYGYSNIETPAVEKNDVLTAKPGDTALKQIYGLHGLAQTVSGNDDIKPYSLRFDLTVPMARYVIDHHYELEFPFKRYQMQKVRRGESHQKGRYKEFYQCDIDVIDKDIDPRYDAETIEVLYKTLQKLFDELQINKSLEVKLNNRKIYDAIFDVLELNEGERSDLMRALDDFYKMDSEDFSTLLGTLIGEEKAKKLELYLDYNLDDLDESENESVLLAKKELQTVYKSLKEKNVNVIVDPYIVRGLGYYSGTVFETFIQDYESFGSICSGGRYDKLEKYISEKAGLKELGYEGVGGSIGLSRLLHRLLDAGLITNTESLSDVMMFNLRDGATKYREEIAEVLRDEGIKVDMYYKDEKLPKQFKYAEKKGIQLGIFAGETEKESKSIVLKDLEARENQTLTSTEELIDIIKQKL